MDKQKQPPKSAFRANAAKKKRPPRATFHQGRFLEAYLKTRSQTEAAIAAGYSPNGAAQAGHRAMKQLLHKFPDLMDDQGVSVEALVQNCLLPALTATRVELAQQDGKFTDMVEIPDHGTRLKAADMALKIHFAYASKEQIQKERSSMRVICVDMPRPIPPKQLEEGGKAKPDGHPPNGEAPKK